MKTIYFKLLLFTLITTFSNSSRAQQQTKAPAKMFQIYEDNDFINIAGKGTDESYTNGTRFEYFYTKEKRPHFFLDRVLPTAGDSSVRVYSFSLTQLMFTPRDISISTPQLNDYPYAGALFVAHNLYSYNKIKKYSITTGIEIGVRGPAAFAGETQTFIHGLINYQKPMGWGNQLPNKVIINVKGVVEKQFYHYKNSFDIIGRADVYAGNTFNAVTAGPIIRFGKMNPYFAGIISQYSSPGRNKKSRKNKQAYLFAKPAVLATASNSILKQSDNNPKFRNTQSDIGLKILVYQFSGGAVLTVNKFSFVFTQSITSAVKEGLYSHQVGNFSLYFSW